MKTSESASTVRKTLAAYLRIMHAYCSIALIGAMMLSLLCRARAQENALRWPAPFNPQGAISSSPALSLDGETIYVGVESKVRTGYVIAVNRAGVSLSGNRPLFEAPRPFSATPAIGADGTLYIGCEDGKFYALHPRTGAKLWEFDVKAPITSSAAIGEDGTIYFGANDAKLHALSPVLLPDGRREIWSFPTGDSIWSSPAIGADGTIYFGSFDKKLYAVTPTGREKWSPFVTGGIIAQGSPAIGPDGTIYIGSQDQKLYAISPADGTKKWDYLVNGGIFSSPVVGADGTIYFGADVNFYAVKPDGTKKWTTGLNATILSSAAIRADGVIIFGADDSKIHALEPDGKERWTFDTRIPSDAIESSPIIGIDGTIYVGSLDGGRLYAINGNGSPLSTYSSWPAFRRNIMRTGRAPAQGTGQLTNISARAQVGGASSALIVGMTITGTSNLAQKGYLLRGVGPTLAKLGVANPMRDPRLDMFSKNVALDLKNDNWGETLTGVSIFDLPETAMAVGAFALPVGSKDAAIVTPLGPGQYAAHVTSVDHESGVALAEVYDVPGTGDPSARIVNLSTRGQVGTGDNVLIPGVVVGGTGTVRLLIRAIGPGLSEFEVRGVLEQPTMTVFSRSEWRASNTGWMSQGFRGDLIAAFQDVGAFALADKSADCALILDAMAGEEYTIQISGLGGTTGEALVEIYVLP